MKEGQFCWNELMTPDVKKAKEFYKALLGWEYEEHHMEHGAYTMIKTEAGCSGGGLMQTPQDKGQIPPHWMTYVTVDDLKQSLKKASDLGATIRMPETPAGDFGLFAIIEDPTGAHIALWQCIKTC